LIVTCCGWCPHPPLHVHADDSGASHSPRLGAPTARAVDVGRPRDQLHCVRVGRFTQPTQGRGLRMRGTGGRRAGAERGCGSGGCGAAPCVAARLKATRRRVRAGTPTPPRVQWGCETTPLAVWRRCDTSQWVSWVRAARVGAESPARLSAAVSPHGCSVATPSAARPPATRTEPGGVRYD